ncbi:MAG: hypothetical protein KDN22_05955 [Verrucomicrobiae bacterium]|nr:hypothetical protein [Verrucomicrobiae bacterium]
MNSLHSNARLNRWVNRDPDAAVRMLTALPATVRKAGLRDAVVAWLDSLDPTSRETAYQSLSINFVGSPKAIEWLTTAPDHPFAEEVLEDLVDSLIENEATATADEWLPDFPPDRAAYVRKRLEAADPSS